MCSTICKQGTKKADVVDTPEVGAGLAAAEQHRRNTLSESFDSRNLEEVQCTRSRAALVATWKNTQISACSWGSIVSKGKFSGFCLRFAEDFDVSAPDWHIAPTERTPLVINACVVPEGTCDVCSSTRVLPSNYSHSKQGTQMISFFSILYFFWPFWPLVTNLLI